MSTIERDLHAGLEHQRAGRLAEAERAYRELLASHPNHAPAIYCLATVALQAAKPQVAADLLSSAIRIDGTQAAYHAALGDACKVLGRSAEALASYRQAVRLREDDAALHNNLGVLLQEQGDLAGALASYEQALRIDPSDVPALFNLAAALDRAGRLDEAAAALKQAVQRQPHDHQARWKLGQLYQALGRPGEAIAQFEFVVRSRPDWAAPQRRFGAAWQAMGHWTKPSPGIAAQLRWSRRTPTVTSTSARRCGVWASGRPPWPNTRPRSLASRSTFTPGSTWPSRTRGCSGPIGLWPQPAAR